MADHDKSVDAEELEAFCEELNGWLKDLHSKGVILDHSLEIIPGSHSIKAAVQLRRPLKFFSLVITEKGQA